MKIQIHKKPNSKEAEEIRKGLIAYNNNFKNQAKWEELVLFVKNSKGQVIAGLDGHSDWGWLFVKRLWVSEDLRGKGYGRRLLLAAEKEAKKRKCKNIWLDTFGFQAPAFYRKMGYKCFGRLKDYPEGYTRYFFTRSLEK